MSLLNSITNELNIYLPLDICNIIIDIIEDVKHTNFKELETHQYWANEFRKNIYNIFHIRTFFLVKLYNGIYRKIRYIICDTKLCNINDNEYEEDKKFNDLEEIISFEILRLEPISIKFDKYLNHETCIVMNYDLGKNFNRLNSNYDNEENFIFDESKEHSNVINDIHHIIGNKKRLICNISCIELLKKYLTQMKDTYENFLMYFKDYKAVRGKTTLFKNNTIKIINKQLKEINKIFVKINTI